MLVDEILSCVQSGYRADEFNIRVLHVDRVRVYMIILLWLFCFYLNFVIQSIFLFLFVKSVVRQNFLDRLMQLAIIFSPLLLDLGQAVLHLVVRLLDRAMDPHGEPLNHDLGVSLNQVAALILNFFTAPVQVNQDNVVELVGFCGSIPLCRHLKLLLSDKEVLEHFLVAICLTFECKLLKGLLGSESNQD